MSYQQVLLFLNISSPSTHNTCFRNNAMGPAPMGFASAPPTMGVTVMSIRHTVFADGRRILLHTKIRSARACLT